MRRWPEAHRWIALMLCWSLGLPLTQSPAQAAGPPQGGEKKTNAKKQRPQNVEVTPGQPAVWSLGQAHYLIANLHDRNRDLSTRMPTPDDLDPNRINSARLEALRTLFQFEGQFNQPLEAKNELETQRFREERGRQREAQDTLIERRTALAETERELGVLNEELVTLKELDRQSTETRAAAKPPLPPSVQDNERKLRVVVLTARVEQKTAEKTRLQSEVNALESTANTPVTAPDLAGPELTAGRGSLPPSTAFDEFVKKAVNNFNQPSVAASMALDNFVGMQYEIIAKQLSLLRDEVGPDERVIFLELPASIYTVDKWADNYIAQVEWEVTRYYDKEPSLKDQDKYLCDTVNEETEFEPYLKLIEDRKQSMLRALSSEQKEAADLTEAELLSILNRHELNAYHVDECLKLTSRDPLTAEVRDNEMPYPLTLDMILSSKTSPSPVRPPTEPRRLMVRALDIIPRQSALNINEHQALVKNVGILGFFKWLSGVGAKLDFQRQREVYEQLVYQDVYASGFGKGSDRFGWTFGPLPGSKRLAPGQRTTYAVLAVPRKTLALELTAKTKVFRRDQRRPKDREEQDVRFVVSVPGPKTDAFVIERVNYTPVVRGGRATVVMKGNFLSPQLGALVNGVPLKRVISIARTGSKEEHPPASPGSGVQGEFEITNTRQMILNFSVGSDFTGTPLITLVTPEKSVTLNYTRMIINSRQNLPTTLHSISAYEPMFIDPFSLDQKVEVLATKTVKEAGGQSDAVEYKIARLRGKGLRHDTDIYVNHMRLVNFPIRFPSSQEIQKFIDWKVLPQKNAGEPHKSEKDGKEADKQAPKDTDEDIVLARKADEFFLKKGNESFAAQESTGSYLLFLKSPEGPWNVRYRQRTRQGIEEISFQQSFDVPDIAPTLLNYHRGRAGSPAAAVLSLKNNVKDNLIDNVQMIDPESGGNCSFQDDGGVTRRVRCQVPRDDVKERDSMTLKVSFKLKPPVEEEGSKPAAGAPAAEKLEAKEAENTKPPKLQDPVILDISLPVQPLVATVVNPGTGTASGYADFPAFVVIRGENLGSVKAVFFGDAQGTDLIASAGGLTVKVPKLEGVPLGQSVVVPVLFQTKNDGDTKVPSGAFYTYLGQPLAEKVVVWPYPPGSYPAMTTDPKKP